jgi:hypothetical protein
MQLVFVSPSPIHRKQVWSIFMTDPVFICSDINWHEDKKLMEYSFVIYDVSRSKQFYVICNDLHVHSRFLGT